MKITIDLEKIIKFILKVMLFLIFMGMAFVVSVIVLFFMEKTGLLYERGYDFMITCITLTAFIFAAFMTFTCHEISSLIKNFDNWKWFN